MFKNILQKVLSRKIPKVLWKVPTWQVQRLKNNSKIKVLKSSGTGWLISTGWNVPQRISMYMIITPALIYHSCCSLKGRVTQKFYFWKS